MPITPNMNMTLPTPSTTPGPTWADNVNAAFDVVDAHDHTSGNGVPVPTAGLDIDDDLSLNSHALLAADYLEMDQQLTTLGPSVTDSLYDVSGNLYFNNGSGTPVQVTVGNAVNVSSTATVPSGVIWPYGGSSAPTGFLLCNGSAVSRATYADLFTAIGTTFGVGDGTTTFNIPNMNGRVPVGAGTYTDPTLGSTTRTLGVAAGEASHVQSATELFAHVHGGLAHTHFIAGNVSTANVTAISSTTAPARQRSAGDALDYSMSTDGTAPTVGLTSSSSITETGNAGASTPANVMQPYLVTNYIIKY